MGYKRRPAKNAGKPPRGHKLDVPPGGSVNQETSPRTAAVTDALLIMSLPPTGKSRPGTHRIARTFPESASRFSEPERDRVHAS